MLKLFLYGLLIWIIPFIAGFFFYDESGQLTTNIFLFKSIMLLVLAAVTITLSIFLLRREEVNHSQKGLTAGLAWFAIPLILDLLVLVPMAGMSIQDYLFQIGLRYLLIPMIVVSNGLAFSTVKAG